MLVLLKRNGVKMYFFLVFFREFKQQHRRQLWKHHLKSEFGLPQTLLRLFRLVQFVKCWRIVLELNSKGLYESSGKEKQSCCVVFPSSTKREIRKVHVIVVQQIMAKKCRKMHDPHAKLLFFQSMHIAFLPSPLSLLKLPVNWHVHSKWLETKIPSGQMVILDRHCPLTAPYFERWIPQVKPWSVYLTTFLLP